MWHGVPAAGSGYMRLRRRNIVRAVLGLRRVLSLSGRRVYRNRRLAEAILFKMPPRFATGSGAGKWIVLSN